MKYHTLFFSRKLKKMLQNLSSAAVLVDALRVKVTNIRGSSINAHGLLNLSNKLGKVIKCEVC